MYYEYPTYDNQTNGPPTQGSRYLHLFRAVRGAAQDAKGKSRVDRRRSGREKWITKNYPVSLGSGIKFTASGNVTNFGRSLRNQGTYSHSRALKKSFLKKIPILGFCLLTNSKSGIIIKTVPPRATQFDILAPRFTVSRLAPQGSGRGHFLFRYHQ